MSPKAAKLPRPGPVHGNYPQQEVAPAPLGLALADWLGDRLSLHGWREQATRTAFAKEAARAAAACRVLTASELPTHASRAAARLLREGFTATAVAQAQGVIGRAIDLELQKSPYPTQQAAAFSLLQDQLVEMDTGEGKTLALLLAAGTAALARVPTHVICANDYLAQRDAETSLRVLTRLNVSVAAIKHDMTPTQRREAYGCPIVYVSATELGFDYLRDRLALLSDPRGAANLEPPLLRGLCLGLIDEADSVLLDHARMPLVLANEDKYKISEATALAIYRQSAELVAGQDYLWQPGAERPSLQPQVLERWRQRFSIWGVADDRRVRQQLIDEALQARHTLHRDVHYVVHGDSVVLIDPTTGRMLHGSVWARGLHRMVCLKENVPPPPATRTAIQITMQTLLMRYCKLGGISGTLRESRWQLGWFYRLGVQRIEPRVPNRRQDQGLRVCASHAQQFKVVCEHAARRSAAGQAVLIGTDSVATADALSQALWSAGLAHQLLTARDDQREAALIANAGAPGTLTVATNIAGRGTDILLPPATLDAGGLHVICCTQNASPRIDRQLLGRAARNGQPGSTERIVSIDDPAFADLLPKTLLRWLKKRANKAGFIPYWTGVILSRMVQALKVCGQFMYSWQLVRHDKLLRESIAPAAQIE